MIRILALGLVIGLSWGNSAMARPFEVFNVQISAQSSDAVKARDEAITQAQRKAFIAITNSTEDAAASVTDTEIARLVRGFSVRNERLASRSYSANFTIRFNPNTLISFTQSRGFMVVAAAQSGGVNAGPPSPPATTGAATTTADGTTPLENPAEASLVPEAVTIDTVVVLPVLDVGSRAILWGDPNPWRELWQKEDYSPKELKIRVPLGDISDVTDVPDTGLLNGGSTNLASLLTRYAASTAYITVIKNQGSGGAMISLYRHDGNRLNFIRKILINPRPGYMFDDAVPAAIQMIVASHKSGNEQIGDAAAVATTPVPVTTDAYGREVRDQELPDTVSPYDAAANPQGAAAQAHSLGPNRSIEVTVPYQSLQQWVGIQNRLRLVHGIKSVVPVRVSPSSAKVRLQTTLTDSAELQRNLSGQRFDLQYLPTGEVVLIGQ